jgi:hypothetical protein
MSIYLATTFSNIVEDAKSTSIFQSDKTVPVMTHELLSIIAHSFQTFNICTGKQHFSLFTAQSAMGTMHEQFYAEHPFISLHHSPSFKRAGYGEKYLARPSARETSRRLSPKGWRVGCNIIPSGEIPQNRPFYVYATCLVWRRKLRLQIG